MVLGRCVEDLLPVSFCFPFCSSFPKSESIARVGVGGFALCVLTPFFFLTLLTCHSFLFLFLALVRAGSTEAELGYSLINKIYITKLFPSSLCT